MPHPKWPTACTQHLYEILQQHQVPNAREISRIISAMGFHVSYNAVVGKVWRMRQRYPGLRRSSKVTTK